MKQILTLQMAAMLAAGANGTMLEMIRGVPGQRPTKQPDPERQSAAEAKRQRRIERNKKWEQSHE